MIRISLHPGFSHFSYVFFQDFSRSKFRFARTVICSKKCCGSLYDHLSLQEGHSITISYVVFKNVQDFSRTFPVFPFFQDFSRPGNLFFSFSRFSRFFRCVGILTPIINTCTETRYGIVKQRAKTEN